MKDQPPIEQSVGDNYARHSRAVVEALQGLRFGSVTVVVQDGLIVQVERVEKRRIVRSTSSTEKC